MTAKNTSIMLLKNVPFNSDYSNTLATTSTTEQFTYFSSKFDVVLQQSHLSYIKPNKGTLQINTPISSDLSNVNYMIFINKSHENRYFYAFINEINYVNDLTIEIVYELDYIQSYLPFIKLNECFIERQHTTSDNLYEHLVTENLDIGDSISVESIDIDLDLVLVVATSGVINMEIPKGIFTSGEQAFTQYSADGSYSNNTMIISPLKYYYSYLTGENAINLMDNDNGWYILIDKLSKAQESADVKAVSCYISPYGVKTIDVAKKQNYQNYTPKNKKLFSFPYTYINVKNFEGKTQNFKFENFKYNSDNTAKFRVLNCLINKGESLCFPMNYAGIFENIEVGISKTKFLTVGVKDDAFYTFLNRELPSAFFSMGSNLVSSAMTGGAGLKSSIVGGATSLGSSFISAMNRPDEIRGLGDSNALQRCLGVDGKYQINIMQMKPEYARNIDEYFTRYGYALNTIATPNIKARPYFTYIKTSSSCVGGAIPNKAKNIINNAFNNGVTFWKPNAIPCDFSQDNSV